jgi:DNA polymerase I
MAEKLHDMVLIDGSGFIFRAFHALPPLTNPNGVPVNAVLGFCNMLQKIIGQYPRAHMAVVFDAARRNFRNDIYPAYKANRDETPPDLIPQFPLIREAVVAFGLPSLELEGYEADDVIATYARMATESGHKVHVVSSDKDLMQLVRDDVVLFDPMKNISIGVEQVKEKFGVAPNRVIDVQALAGDTSDNVPGVPGIGVKTAAQLIEQFGDLENLLNRAAEIPQPKRRETLINHADDARISYKLVRLDDHAPVPLRIDDLVIRQDDPQKLIAFLQSHGFRSILTRMNQSAPVAQVETTSAKPTSQTKNLEKNYQLITEMKMLEHVLAKAQKVGVLAFDTETTGLTPALVDLVGISLCVEAGEAFYIPLNHGGKKDLLGEESDTPPQLKISDVMRVLKPVLEDSGVLKIAHNAKYDMQFFFAHDIHVTPLDDTMLLSYALDGTAHGHGLDELSKLFCDHDMITYDSITGTGRGRISFAEVSLDKACEYAAEDADYTLRLWQILKPRVVLEKKMSLYEDIERPLVPIIAGMEWTGIRVDQNILKHLSQTFGARIYELEQRIHAAAGRSFNIGSPKQLGAVLFDEMGLPGGSKTKTGEWSTAVDVLEDLSAQGHAFVDLILEWRHLSKLKSTYTEALQDAISPRDGRVHTSFSLAATTTGRLSSSDPNLQNIPIRTEEGRMIRTAFVASEGHKLISADYSQIELRIVAEMANIPALKKAFLDGIDIHIATAAEVFDVAIENVTSDLRRAAKAVNFGIIYGISGFGLSKQLGNTPAEAQAIIKRYFARFPELQDYMDAAKEEARKCGHVKTLFGRTCTVAGIADKNPARRQFAERQAINAPIQGTAADLVKLAMVDISHAIDAGELKAKLLLQVHDELIFEVAEQDAESACAKIKHIMESISPFSIPLTAEAKIGTSWAEAH